MTAQSLHAPPILVAGAGIGGLTAALALARHGFRVCVLEKASSLGEVGAGIQLGPNAFHVFDRLGVGDAARSMAVFIDRLRLMDALSGEQIASINLGEAFRARFKNPYGVVHRGDLHKVFLDACRAHPLVELQTGAHVTGYDQDGSGVSARLADGTSLKGRALIGADGLWSKIRAQMLGDGAPRVTGHSTYRSVIPTEDMPEDLRWNAATLWAGPKCHIVHYPLSGWKVFNLVVTFHNQAPAPVAGQPVSHEEVARGFAHVHPMARKIIDIGRDWKLWVLCDRDPADRWSEGHVALLGDAAHPTLQYLAQGACMAMEDSICLADELAARPHDIAAALVAYQRQRSQRSAHVQLISREIGEHIYHPAGVHAALRNSIMAAKSDEDWCNVMAWLYDGPKGDVSVKA